MQDDEWLDAQWHARHVRPPYRHRESARYFAPEVPGWQGAPGWQGGGLSRSRSQGHAPIPNVTIYNTMDQEASPRLEQQGPMSPPRGRRQFLTDELEDDYYRYSRSRSRGRSDAPYWMRDNSPGVREYQLQQAQERMREHEWHTRHEKEEELLRKKMELKCMRDKLAREEEEARIKKEQDRIKREYEMKRLQDEAKRDAEEREAKDEKDRAIQKYIVEKEKREREAKETARRAVEEHERKEAEAKREQKEKEKAIIAKLKQEEIEREEKEKREYEEFLLKQEKKRQDEAAKKKRREDEIQEEMRKRLAEVGFQDNQIKAIFDPKKSQALVPGALPNNPLHVHTPTYVKVHKEHLSIETLRYFDIPWEWDSTDRNYIIILCELDQRQTDALFEHTQRIRTRTMTHLLVEQKPNHPPDYTWVRHKRRPSASPKPEKKTPQRIGFKQIFF